MNEGNHGNHYCSEASVICIVLAVTGDCVLLLPQSTIEIVLMEAEEADAMWIC